MQLVHGASHRKGVVPRVVLGTRFPDGFRTAVLALALATTTTTTACAPSWVATAFERVRPASRQAEAWLLFQRHCRSCHGNLGAGDGPYAATFRTPAPDLRPLAAAAADGQTLVEHILRGSPPEDGAENAMPAFGDVLSDRQARAIVALLAHLGRELQAEDSDGARLFRARCASCHGPSGEGDGPLAAELIPRPRDLTRSWYRFRSSPSGEGPHIADLSASLERGLGVTAMGRFGALGHDRIEQLAAFVGALTTLDPDPEQATGAVPPAGGEEEIARGRVLYDEARCWQCHGVDGRGDGPSGRELRDDGGRASLPANLRRPWRLKGGVDVASLARTIGNGLNGTPMPSYGEVLETDDLWALAHYVRSLGEARPVVPIVLPVRRSTRRLPRDPNDRYWTTLDPTSIPLGPQSFVAPRWHRPAIDVAEVRVGWFADELAFHLAWDDPFEDRASEDVALVAQSVDDPRRPGRWRLPDQASLRLIRVPEEGPLPPLEGHEDGPLQARLRWSSEAQQPSEVDGCCASASFDNGRWQLVLARSRVAPETRQLLRPGARLALSLQLWEGSQGEHGPRHAISSWIPFTLPEG